MLERMVVSSGITLKASEPLVVEITPEELFRILNGKVFRNLRGDYRQEPSR